VLAPCICTSVGGIRFIIVKGEIYAYFFTMKPARVSLTYCVSKTFNDYIAVTFVG